MLLNNELCILCCNSKNAILKLNRDRCCRFKLLCALKIMKNSKQAKSFYSLWDTKICKQNLFTPINCLDNAVCLHFTETHKIA